MRRTITKEEIDQIFSDPNLTNQHEVAVALYRLAFPDWDEITDIKGWPSCGSELALYTMDKFMKYDQVHHPSVMNGGLWMNKGWAQDEKLGPWELSTDEVVVTKAPPLNMNPTKEEMELISHIVNRVIEWCAGHGEGYCGPPRMDLEMDITATHLNGCPLRLKELSEARLPDLEHDVMGIHKHLNRKTGKLEGHFQPRFADMK